MNLHRIRGGSKTDLESKKYNISIGISLGNKWFTTSNIIELIQWTLRYTREYVIVCTADEIHAINLEVRNRKSRARSLEQAQKMGGEIIKNCKEEIERTFSQTDKDKIRYATWKDVLNNVYRKKVEYLYSEYDTNSDFQKIIQGFVRSHIADETRSFSEEDIYKLGTYIP